MTTILLVKFCLILLMSFACISALTKDAFADGLSPPVNANMGCTAVGEPFLFDGTSASCGFMNYSSLVAAPIIPVVQAFEGTTQRLNPIVVSKTAAVAGGAGNAVFNITSDGISTGAALCPNGVMLNSPNISVNDATAPYQFSWAWSNSNKTMTVLSQKASGLAVLTFTLLGVPSPVPNGTSVNATIVCY